MVLKKIMETCDNKTRDKHRIKNIGDSTLTFVEVQTGTYFGEDDIVRLDDDYNRIKDEQT